MIGRQSIPNFSTPLKQYAAQVSVDIIITNVYTIYGKCILLISGTL